MYWQIVNMFFNKVVNMMTYSIHTTVEHLVFFVEIKSPDFFASMVVFQKRDFFHTIHLAVTPFFIEIKNQRLTKSQKLCIGKSSKSSFLQYMFSFSSYHARQYFRINKVSVVESGKDEIIMYSMKILLLLVQIRTTLISKNH